MSQQPEQSRLHGRRWFLSVSSLLAGIISGLCGAGGGILLCSISTEELQYDKNGNFVQKRDVFANALCVTLPISLSAGLSYLHGGAVSFTGFSPLLLPAITGGLCGAVLLDRINPALLRVLFALLVIWSGISLLFR